MPRDLDREGKGPRISEIEQVAKILGISRNGNSMTDFTKHVVKVALLRCRIDPAFDVKHSAVSEFCHRFSKFDPVEGKQTTAVFEEPDEPNEVYLKSQVASYIKEIMEW
jgi:hypothetical protein